MGLYKKNPIEVDALQFTGDNYSAMSLFTGGHTDSSWTHRIKTFNPIGTYLMQHRHPYAQAELWVAANEAWLPIEVGEWVIKDHLGFYPCKDEVFEKNYSSVVDPEEALQENGGYPVIGPECFSNPEKTVISWKGNNFYKSCDKHVTGDAVNGPASFCVKREDHPGTTCEDFDGHMRVDN